jgi:hypothetical protein
MYPVRLGIGQAKQRVRRLLRNGHCAEALLTAVFTFEKTIHRTLKQLIVSAGFTNKSADKLLKNFRGLEHQIDVWSCFDPDGRSLPTAIGSAHWQHINAARTMRNRMVHGAQAYDLQQCRTYAERVLDLIDDTVASFNEAYSFDGWSNVCIRHKSKLHHDPKVMPAAP